MLLVQEGNSVVLHYLDDDTLGRAYLFQNDREAERFCNLCRRLERFIEEAGEAAHTLVKAPAHRALLQELCNKEALEAVIY